MAWEKFDASKYGNTYELIRAPAVSLQTSGKLSLNRAAWKLLGEPKQVELSYDRETRRILIGTLENDDESMNQYALRIAPAKNVPNPSSYIVNVRSFCNYFGIKRDVATRRQVHLEPDGSIIFPLDLSPQPQPKVRATHSRTKGMRAPATPAHPDLIPDGMAWCEVCNKVTTELHAERHYISEQRKQRV